MKKFDKYFRDNLKDAKTEYSSDLWAKIASGLDEGQKKTRPLLFYITSLLAVLLIAGLGSFFLLNDDHLSVRDNPIASNEIIQLSNQQQLKLEDTEYESSNTELTANKNTSDSDLTIQKVATRTDDHSHSSKPIYKISDTQSKKVVNQEPITFKLGTQNIVDDQLLVASTLNSESVLLESTSSDRVGSFNVLSQLLPIRSISPFDFVYADELNAPEPYYTDVECGENEDLSKPGFGIDIYVSPDLAFRDLNSKGDGETQYLIERERTENQSLSFSAGARISYTLRSGLTLRSGINYSQINETFNYTESRTQTTIIRDEDGNIISIEEELIEVDKKSSNSYKSVDVPILIGLEMPVNDRFSLSMNTGLFLTAAFSSRGKILSPELEPVFITEGSGDLQVYKSSLGVSYYGSIGFHHELSPGLELLIEPNLRYYSQSFTIADYPLTQDYIKFGILSGIKFRF